MKNKTTFCADGTRWFDKGGMSGANLTAVTFSFYGPTLGNGDGPILHLTGEESSERKEKKEAAAVTQRGDFVLACKCFSAA